MKSHWSWILALQLLVVVPFVIQPIHLDDPIFVDIGRNALKTPWHAQDFPYCFDGYGDCVPDMASHSHPPFVGYWIGLLILLFGDGPRLNLTLHLGFLVFPIMFAMGMYRLAQRFTSSPFLAAALAVVSPSAIVMSHMLMADFPTLALWTLAIALYVDGVDQGQPRRVWVSGVLLTLAAFSSYPALLAALLCWFYSRLKRSSMAAAFWAPLLAIGWMTIWLTYSSVYFHRFVLGRTAKYFVEERGSLTGSSVSAKLLALPIMLAGTLALPIPLIRSALRTRKGGIAIAWAVAGIVLAQLQARDYPLTQRFFVALLLSLGGWIIIGLISQAWRCCMQTASTDHQHDAMMLSVWAAAAILAVLFVYPYASARYYLPLLPPLILLAFFKSSPLSPTLLRWSAGLGLSVAITVGLCLSLADFEMARVHQDIARTLGQTFRGWQSQVRFGGEWGFRHYMLEQGFRQFLYKKENLGPGQFIVNPQQAVPYVIPQELRSRLVPVFHKSWRSSIPIRSMSREARAGFYSSAWGLLPFSFSDAPVEEITVEQVSYVAGLQGAVDLRIPPEGAATVPYSGPLPVRVQFLCSADCPIRVHYDHDGHQSDVTVMHDGSVTYFDIFGHDPGEILVQSDKGTVLGHWVTLPASYEWSKAQ